MRRVGCLEQFVTPGERSPAAFRHYSFSWSQLSPRTAPGQLPASCWPGWGGPARASPAPAGREARPGPGSNRGPEGVLARAPQGDRGVEAGSRLVNSTWSPRAAAIPGAGRPHPHRCPSRSASPPAPPVCFQGRTCE